MDLPLEISWLVIIILEGLVGIALNSVIVADSKAAVKNKLQTNPTAVLNLMIGLVNILLLCVIIIEAILYMAWQSLFLHREVLSFFLVTVDWLLYLSFWLMAWLCVCYFAIVANFTHRLFLWLKKAFPSLLPYLLVLSAVESFATSVMSLLDASLLVQSNVTTPYYFSNMYRILSPFFGCWLPLLLASISIIFTVLSILRHIWRLKQNGAGFKGRHLQAHINAIRTMILLLLVSVTSYLVTIFGFLITDITNIYFINWLFVASFPTLEAIILILASSKLKKMFQMNCLTRDGNPHDVAD